MGKEILKLDKKIIAPSHSELAITNPRLIERVIKKYKPQVILHLASANKPPQHETDPIPGLTVNITGTANLCLAAHKFKIKLVYASTDFVYSGKGPHKEEESLYPASRFAWSKLGGECAVRMLKNYLILRLDFGSSPFPWQKVYKNHYVSKLYVNEMAPLVLKAAKSDASGVMNLGGPRISLEQYARKTRPDIETVPKPDWVPKDSSMDTAKMKRELK